MSPRHQLLLFLGLVAVIAPMGPEPPRTGQSKQIAIIDVSGESSASEPRRDIGRSFDQSSACSNRRPASTIREILGANVEAIAVHHYDKPTWPNMMVVTEYLHRVMDAHPEGGGLQSEVYWAEGRFAEIVASVEFTNGRKSRLEFANGYTHVEDGSGCQWWGRYLGPDRSKWIVRR
jgi:hypothetical protein